jgi:RND family efflux transporter MFP subunit
MVEPKSTKIYFANIPLRVLIYTPNCINGDRMTKYLIPSSAQGLRISASALGLSLMALFPIFASAQTGQVPTAVVQSKLVGSAFELEGAVQAVTQSTVSAQASGRIVTLAVKAGDRVRAGQLLATIDDREAAAGIQKSQAQINQADAELRNAQATLERTRDLQSKGFVSKAALDVAGAQYKGSLAARDQAGAAARLSGISQGFTKVTAPFEGWVLQTHVQAGDLAVPGVPMVTVYAPQPLRAVVQVPGSRAAQVRSASQTLVQLDGEPGQSIWVAPVSRSALPSADPVSQTTEWRLELASKDAANLVPGQQVRVRFTSDKAGVAGRLLLPAAAVVRRGELTAVYVATGAGFSLRAVRLGARQGDAGIEVLAGLVAGDVVALDPIRAGFTPTIAPTSSNK